MILDKLKDSQLTLRSLIKKSATINIGLLIVFLNGIFLAIMTKNCSVGTDDFIDRIVLSAYSQILLNGLLVITFIDIKIIHFFKMIIVGSLGFLISSEIIGFYFQKNGELCKPPVLWTDNFGMIMIISMTIGVLYFCFSDNNTTSIVEEQKEQILKDRDFY
jgi:hypothetical protein